MDAEEQQPGPPAPEPPQYIPSWCVGHHLPAPDEPVDAQLLDAQMNAGYDLITAHITNSLFQARVETAVLRARSEQKKHVQIEPLTADEVLVQPGDFVSGIVAVTSPWIEVDSDDELLSHVSRQVLDRELEYAAFCGVTHVVVAGPKHGSRNIWKYAQAIDKALTHSSYMQLMLQLPYHGGHSGPGHKSAHQDPFAAWDAWNTIRTVCKYNALLSVALQVPLQIPSKHLISKWFAEPVRMLLFSSQSFTTNGTGFPVLSRVHQGLLTKYMKLRPTPYIILSDTDSLPTLPPGAPLLGIQQEPEAYIIYIRHLQKNQPPQSVVERYGAGYQDYLQAPLQPLADNLESITYEVFEKDPVKYDQYEKAIALALADRSAADSIVVAVVGAGRGPLVTRALRAAETSGRSIHLFAVEKNPNAYVHLLRQNANIWNGGVTVVKSDMRSWKPPFRVDILISELLGSFGDNELSPECLDGVQHVLNPSAGIMIPQSYSAHFTPIMTPKIYADVASRKHDPDAFETPYVVMLQAIESLAKDEYIHRAWEFSHPLPPTLLSEAAALGGGLVGLGDGGNDHNLRCCKATFKIPRRGVVHGLAGYFESVLYGSVELSTRPDTIEQKSKDMISWFPIFFPLKTPMYMPDNSEVDISMWRQSDERKVWYEWIVEGFVQHGEGARSRLSTSDLHTSKKNGCLM